MHLVSGMATRAEQFRSQNERARRGAPKHPTKVPKRFPGEAATELIADALPPNQRKRRGIGHTATRNVSRHAGKKATFALEDSATKPSRKSTRKSANRSKFESALHRRAADRTESADARARKTGVAKEKPAPNSRSTRSLRATQPPVPVEELVEPDDELELVPKACASHAPILNVCPFGASME